MNYWDIIRHLKKPNCTLIPQRHLGFWCSKFYLTDLFKKSIGRPFFPFSDFGTLDFEKSHRQNEHSLKEKVWSWPALKFCQIPAAFSRKFELSRVPFLRRRLSPNFRPWIFEKKFGPLQGKVAFRKVKNNTKVFPCWVENSFSYRESWMKICTKLEKIRCF